MMLLRQLSPVSRTTSKQLQDHPSCRSWRGHEPSLLRYTLSVLTEWRRRDLQDNIEDPVGGGADHWGVPREWATMEPAPPPWLGWERLHASHRAYLMARDPDWYHQFCWDEGPRRALVWPQRLPVPGDKLVSDSGRVLTVSEIVGGECHCLEGDVVSVSSVSRRELRIATSLPETEAV
jgi:hypothetical protein